MGLRAAALIATLLVGCNAQEVTLVVDLRSDLVPVQEVSRAEVRATREGATVGSSSFDLSGEVSLLDARRIAELSVPTGQIQLTVTLVHDTGAPVLARDVIVEVRAATAVTVLMTRSCQGVSCPDASDAAATACLGGGCVRPECTPETPELCPISGCTQDAECPGGPVCTRPVCLSGACGLFPDRSACDVAQICDPLVGCDDLPDNDAGSPRVDAGPRDGGATNDAGPGANCAAVCPGTCADGTCVLTDMDSPSCPDGVPCQVECNRSGSCSGLVTCGDGDCQVSCQAPGSCANGVDCARGRSCDIDCAGDSSCPTVICGGDPCDIRCGGPDGCGSLICGPGTNRIDCPGPNTCDAIDCTASRTADIQCTAPDACTNPIVCGGDSCTIDCVFADCGAIDCSAACQCEVTCSFSGCMPAAVCPGTCQSGRGCMMGAGPACGC